MVSKVKVDSLETTAGTGTIALSNQLSGMSVASLPTSGTLPALDGSALTSIPAANLTGSLPAGMGGKVLQVDGNNSGAYFTSSSTSWIATTTAINITPSSTSSKILILYTSPHCYKDNTTNSYEYFTIYRDSTNLSSSGFQVAMVHSMSFNNFGFNAAITHLDAPTTTSQITYTIYMRTNNSGQLFAYKLDGLPSIVAMEIAG
jgi:hypothetical protein